MGRVRNSEPFCDSRTGAMGSMAPEVCPNVTIIPRGPAKHVPPDILMQDRTFHYFIIFTIIVPLEHDSVIRRNNALGDRLARRFARPRRVRPCRVNRRCCRSSISDALGYYPASAKAGGRIGCRVARPLGKASASELA